MKDKQPQNITNYLQYLPKDLFCLLMLFLRPAIVYNIASLDDFKSMDNFEALWKAYGKFYFPFEQIKFTKASFRSKYSFDLGPHFDL